MAFYKFLRDEHVDGLCGGSIRMGSLGFYRVLELLSGDSWIGDKADARTEYRIKDTVLHNPDGSLALSMKGNIVVTYAKGYVFSFSEGMFDDLYREFSVPQRGAPGYASAVEILHPRKLLRAFTWARCTSGRHAGKRLPEIGKLHVGKVAYDEVPPEIDPFGRLPTASSGFVKHGRFAKQREWRIFLECAETDDAMMVQTPDANRLLSATHRGIDRPVLSSGDENALLTLEELARSALRLQGSAHSTPDFNEGWMERFDREQATFRERMETDWQPAVIKAYAAARASRPSARIDELIVMGTSYQSLLIAVVEYLGLDMMSMHGEILRERYNMDLFPKS